MEKKTTLRSVARAADVLLYFAGHDEAGITDISRDLKLAKGTIHNLLKALREKGLVEQNPENSKYRVGVKIYQLGMRWQYGRDVRSVSLPYMNQLSKELSAIIHLGILAGDQAVIAQRAEPPMPFIVVPKIGWALPLHSSATGKILLAFSPREVRDGVIRKLKLVKFTNSTITDVNKLKHVLGEVCANGYAIETGESLEGVLCIAAPIRDYTNTVVASLSICTSSDRYPPGTYPEIIEKIKNAAETISINLGYDASSDKSAENQLSAVR